MKLIGFYVFEGTLISPTVFREMALEKVKFGKIKEPTFRDRYDVIEFEYPLPKLEVEESLKEGGII